MAAEKAVSEFICPFTISGTPANVICTKEQTRYFSSKISWSLSRNKRRQNSYRFRLVKEQIFSPFCEWNNDSEETKRFKSLKRIISSCIPFFFFFLSLFSRSIFRFYYFQKPARSFASQHPRLSVLPSPSIQIPRKSWKKK